MGKKDSFISWKKQYCMVLNLSREDKRRISFLKSQYCSRRWRGLTEACGHLVCSETFFGGCGPGACEPAVSLLHLSLTSTCGPSSLLSHFLR